jgi:mutator protein MutT
MPMIEAISAFGNKIKIPKEKFSTRVSGYAILIHEGKMLLVNLRSNGKWFFPGGKVEIGEKIEDAIKREVKEEAGIEIEVEKFLTFKETYFYYDPTDEAWQNYSFFFICKPLSFEPSEKYQVEDDDANKPTWVELKKLKKDDFPSPADEIFQLL